MKTASRLAFGEEKEIFPGNRLALMEVRSSLPFKASHFTLAPNSESKTDLHEESEVWLVVRGSGTLQSGDATITLRAGDAVHFSPDVDHKVSSGDEGIEIYCLWWLAP